MPHKLVLHSIKQYIKQCTVYMAERKRNHTMQKLLTNNTGVSAKSAFMLGIMLMGCIILLVLCFAIIWEVVRTDHATLDFNGVAAIIGAVTSLFVAAGLPKIFAERHYSKNDNQCNNDKQQSYTQTTDSTNGSTDSSADN